MSVHLQRVTGMNLRAVDQKAAAVGPWGESLRTQNAKRVFRAIVEAEWMSRQLLFSFLFFGGIGV
jgi:hypothetical protein